MLTYDFCGKSEVKHFVALKRGGGVIIREGAIFGGNTVHVFEERLQIISLQNYSDSLNLKLLGCKTMFSSR